MHLAPVAIYVFGYAKFVASQARLRRQRRRRLFGSSSSASPPPGAGESCSSAGGGDQAATSSPLFCDGLSPHVFAVTLLLLVAAAKAPAFYALGMLYYVCLKANRMGKKFLKKFPGFLFPMIVLMESMSTYCTS
jgi:hypothetical protein